MAGRISNKLQLVKKYDWHALGVINKSFIQAPSKFSFFFLFIIIMRFFGRSLLFSSVLHGAPSQTDLKNASSGICCNKVQRSSARAQLLLPRVLASSSQKRNETIQIKCFFPRRDPDLGHTNSTLTEWTASPPSLIKLYLSASYTSRRKQQPAQWARRSVIYILAACAVNHCQMRALR